MFYIHFSFIYIKSFFITINIKLYICWYCWCWGLLSVFSWSWIQFTLIQSHHSCYIHWSSITVIRTAATVLKHVETHSIQMAFKCYCLKQNDQRSCWSGDLSRLNSLDLFWNSLFNILIQNIPLVISTSLEKQFLYHLQISLWSPYFVFLLFVSSERYHFLFFF